MKKDVLINSFFTLLGRSLGFLIPFFIASWYGSTAETDAFFLSYAILLFVSWGMGNVLENIIVSHVGELNYEKNRVGAFVRSVLFKGTGFLAVALFLLILAGKPALGFLRFSPGQTRLLGLLILEMLPMVFLQAWTDTLNGVLNAYRNFFVSALSPLFRSAAVLGAIFLLKPFLGIHAVAWGYVLGEGLRLGFSLVFFNQRIGPLRGEASAPAPDTSLFFQNAFIQMLGISFINFTTVIDQGMASWFGEGSVSVYAYSEWLRNIPLRLIFIGLGPVALSYWGKQLREGSAQFSWQEIRKNILTFTVITAGICLCLFLAKDSLVALALGRSKLSPTQMEDVSRLFSVLLIGIPIQVISLLAMELLILFRRSSFSMGAGMLRLLLNAPMNWLLMRQWGLAGIAASTVILDLGLAALTSWQARRQVLMQGKEKKLS